jgi:hypothetical protein
MVHQFYQIFTICLNTGGVKPCCLGRPSWSISLIPHEEYIIMGRILQTPQIQLHEIANEILNSTCTELKMLCGAVHMLGITRKKYSTDRACLCTS